MINLSQENEPDIWNAIRRNALLENVTVDKKGKIDYADKSVTENTRVSYPIFHIENIVKPVSKAPAAKKVIFLSADAFGVLPPVSILTPEQTKYYFLSGFTAKLAGTERGITEPTPTFSACFGAAFLSLHPTKYGEELVKKMQKSGAKAYLVNTGWNGTGKRISIKDTRGIIDAILDGSIDKAPTKTMPIFDFVVPTVLPGVDPAILDPRDTYKSAKEWGGEGRGFCQPFREELREVHGQRGGQETRNRRPEGPKDFNSLRLEPFKRLRWKMNPGLKPQAGETGIFMPVDQAYGPPRILLGYHSEERVERVGGASAARDDGDSCRSLRRNCIRCSGPSRPSRHRRRAATVRRTGIRNPRTVRSSCRSSLQ